MKSKKNLFCLCLTYIYSNVFSNVSFNGNVLPLFILGLKMSKALELINVRMYTNQRSMQYAAQNVRGNCLSSV